LIVLVVVVVLDLVMAKRIDDEDEGTRTIGRDEAGIS
jgi:hypothetical protein